MSTLTMFLRHLWRLSLPGDTEAPWRLAVWDDQAETWRQVGGAGAGSPLLRPGGLQHAVEVVVLPADPPDPVMFGGDFVYVRRMQPDFTLSPDGDLTMVEGA